MIVLTILFMFCVWGYLVAVWKPNRKRRGRISP